MGMRFLIKLLMGLLTIKELEKRVSDLFDIKARAVISHYPESVQMWIKKVTSNLLKEN